MEGFLNFFKGLGDIIGSLVDFVFGVIEDLLYVIGLLGSLILKIPELIGWLPSACISLVITTFGIVLIYKILGREG